MMLLGIQYDMPNKISFNLREDSNSNAKYLFRVTVACLYIGVIVRCFREVAKSDY